MKYSPTVIGKGIEDPFGYSVSWQWWLAEKSFYAFSLTKFQVVLRWLINNYYHIGVCGGYGKLMRLQENKIKRLKKMTKAIMIRIDGIFTWTLMVREVAIWKYEWEGDEKYSVVRGVSVQDGKATVILCEVNSLFHRTARAIWRPIRPSSTSAKDTRTLESIIGIYTENYVFNTSWQHLEFSSVYTSMYRIK